MKSTPRRNFSCEIDELSEKQKDLRLQISASRDSNQVDALKTARNRIMHQIRERLKENKEKQLEAKLSEINRMKGDA